MKHKLISLAAAVCIILVAAVPGFGASACGDSPKQFVSNRAGAGFLYNIHKTAIITETVTAQTKYHKTVIYQQMHRK